MKGFFRRLDEIDAIIKAGGSCATAESLVSLMTDLASTAYTLNILDAGWLEPLESLGYFRDYPLSLEGAKARPREIWPAFAYLKRIAKAAPEDDRIAQALWRILSFMQPPKSFTIVRDMVEISIMLPREMRRGIVPVVQRALSTADNVEYSNVAELVNSLAVDGDVPAALRLFATLFAALPPDAGRPVPAFPSQARTLMDSWNYRQEMEKCLVPLTKAGELDFLQSLCRILDQHLRIAAKNGFQGPDDFSYIWRPAIEAHDQNVHDDPRDAVITAIRDCAISIASEMPSCFTDIVKMMESQQWAIFTRITLFLLAESPSASPRIIARYSMEPYFFSEVGVRHEYALLLKNRFKTLSSEEQLAVLKMIENGPDVASYAAYIQRAFARPAIQEDIISHSRHWQYDWLSFIESDLPKEWKVRFDALKREFGEPENPDFPYYAKSGFVAGGIGSLVFGSNEKPGLEMILEKNAQQRGASVSNGEELQTEAHDLRNLTEDDHKTITKRAEEVAILPVPLLDAIASALLSPVNEWKGTELPAALHLGVSMAERAATVGSETDRDALVELATRVVYQLVSDGDDRVSAEQLPMLRKIMMSLLPLVRTDEGERKRGEEVLDPLGDAINCLSGRIVDAGVKVALLERRLSGNAGGSLEEPNWLLRNLSAILSRLGDSETRVSAILGYRFPSLMHLSRSWAVEHTRSIFPLLPLQKQRWTAAWCSYVMYAGAYDDAFQILQEQYAKAVAEMLEKPPLKKARGNPESGLAQHLAAYYWRGRLTVRDQLFQDFTRSGSEAAMNGFLSMIGRGMKNETVIPPQLLEALRALAVWMVSKWRPRRRSAKKALSAFGWWIPHTSLGDPRWRLDLLTKAAVKAGTVQNPDQVLKTLEELASDLPNQVVSCLRALALGSPSESVVYFLASRSELILEKAMQGASTTTAERIAEIADHFGSLGHFEYRRFAILA